MRIKNLVVFSIFLAVGLMCVLGLYFYFIIAPSSRQGLTCGIEEDMTDFIKASCLEHSNSDVTYECMDWNIISREWDIHKWSTDSFDVMAAAYLGYDCPIFVKTEHETDKYKTVELGNFSFVFDCETNLPVWCGLSEYVGILTIWSHRTAYSTQRNVMGWYADMAKSRDINYTLSVTKRSGITHIFIQKFSMYIDSSMQERYGVDFIQFLEDNPEHFKKVYENGLELQQCINQGGCDGTVIYEVVY